MIKIIPEQADDDIPTALTHYRNCGDFPMAVEKVKELENSAN